MHDLTQTLLNIDISSTTAYRANIYIPQLIECITYHNERYYIYADPIITDEQWDTLFATLKTLEEQYPEYIYPHSPTQVLTGQISTGYSKAKHQVPLRSLANSYNAQDIDKRYDQMIKLLDKEDNQSSSGAGPKGTVEESREDGNSGDCHVVPPRNDVSISYIIEPKFDGSSVELIYTNGTLTQGITRGDGTTGEDITANIKMLRNLPAYIPAWKDVQRVSLRGEVVMPISQFDQLNHELEEAGQKVFANPRNACAGTLRLLDSGEVYRRGLVVFVFEVLGEYMSDIYTDDVTLLAHLGEIGIPIYDWTRHVHTRDELQAICADTDLKKQFDEANIEFDGLVIKINEHIYRSQIGSTEHHPKRAIAYKYPTTKLATQLLDIDYQVGRFGTITPVAVLEPLAIGGTIVSKASLHNFDWIAERDIRIGDTLYIQRSGEVIPYIVDVDYALRPESAQAVTEPTACPICASTVDTIEGQVAIRCTNDSCPAKLLEQTIHACSKNALYISGMGTSMIQQMIESKLITKRWDIYTLPAQTLTLRSLPGIDTKKIDKLTSQLTLSLSKDLWRWIHALGILYIGKKVSQDLAKHYYIWLEESCAMSLESGDISTSKNENDTKEQQGRDLLVSFFQDTLYLESIYGIGEQSIQSLGDRARSDQATYIAQFFKNNDLIVAALHPDSDSSSRSDQDEVGIFSGLKVCITGSFAVSRDELGDIVQAQGGRVVSSVSSKTDILMAGEKSGSKLSKAEALGIDIWDSAKVHEVLDIYIQERLDLSNKKTAPVEQLGLFG